MSTQPLPVHLLDGPAAGLQALGRFPLAHYLRPLHLNVLPLLLGQAVSMARETAPRSAPSPGSGLSVPCRTRFWSAPERSKWMTRPVWGGSQTRVCDTGPQFTPFSLFRCGSQRYSAIRTVWRERYARDLRLRPPQSLRTVGQRPRNSTPAVAGRRRGAFSHLSERRHLQKLRYKRLADLALSGLPAGSRRHFGCGAHRPHRAALAGHHGQHPRSATAQGENSQPGR